MAAPLFSQRTHLSERYAGVMVTHGFSISIPAQLSCRIAKVFIFQKRGTPCQLPHSHTKARKRTFCHSISGIRAELLHSSTFFSRVPVRQNDAENAACRATASVPWQRAKRCPYCRGAAVRSSAFTGVRRGGLEAANIANTGVAKIPEVAKCP
jgi:hypothetical protein